MPWNPKKKGRQKKAHAAPSRTVYGLHPVEEHIRALPHCVHEIYLLPAFKGSHLDLLARQAAIPVHYESPGFFESFAQQGSHQGVAARLDPFPYASLQNIVAREADLLLVLDGILDPRNLGALLRTGEAAGVGGVILPKHHSAPISAVVEKAAAGATAHLPICRFENLSRALSLVRNAGYWIVGLAPDAQQTLYDFGISKKIALLLGNEEKGIRPLSRKACDALVAIPMQGKIESLNVSVSGAIALYEFLRRKVYRISPSS